MTLRHGRWGVLATILFLAVVGCQTKSTQPVASRDRLEPPFEPARDTRRLSVQKSGTGTGTVTSSPAGIQCGSTCSVEFAENSTVTLTATPASGSKFSGSSGACSGTGNCITTLWSDRSVTATFTATGSPPPPPPPGDSFTVVVQKSLSGQGNGTVTSSPAGIDCGADCDGSYPAGTNVTFTATPTSGQFTGWTVGPCAGSSNPSCTFPVNAHTTITAAFAGAPSEMVFLESTLPDGNVGADYSTSINTNGGGGGQDRFSIVAGSLPDGLQMQSFFGVQSTIITGRPTRTQTSTFTVRAQDDVSSATRTFTITIRGAVPIAITLPGPVAKSGTLGQFYFQNLFGSGGKTPYTWSITSGQLPPGLRIIRASNGNRIEGTPTARGTFTFNLTMRDSAGQQVTQSTSITIN